MPPRLTLIYRWITEVEASRNSALHAALYLWLAFGLLGVQAIYMVFDSDHGYESVDRLLGGGFWWWNWLVLLISSLVMFTVSQVLIFSLKHKKFRYAGYFLMGGADIGTFLGIASYFTALYNQADLSASANWFRMCMAGFILTALAVFIVRDVNRLIMIELVRVRRDGS